MEPLRVAVIGAGRHARGHFEMIANEPRVQLECIAELDQSRLDKSAAKHKPKAVYTAVSYTHLRAHETLR